MHVLQGLRQLADVLGGAGLVKPLPGLLLQRLVHLPTGRELQDEVDPSVIIKIPEQPADVRKSES